MKIIKEDLSGVDEDMVRGGWERYGSYLRGTKTKEKMKFKKNSILLFIANWKWFTKSLILGYPLDEWNKTLAS